MGTPLGRACTQAGAPGPWAGLDTPVLFNLLLTLTVTPLPLLLFLPLLLHPLLLEPEPLIQGLSTPASGPLHSASSARVPFLHIGM